jgi:hypothetical protein
LRKLSFLAAVLLAALPDGSAPDVTRDFDSEANFEHYHTYERVDIG